MSLAPALTRRFPASALSTLPVRLLSAALLAVGGFAVLCAPSMANAQTPGSRDTTFNSAESGATFYALTLENVGGTESLFLAGDLGQASRIVTSSGEFDATFALEEFGFTSSRIIYTSVLEQITVFGQPSPKILLGGLFGRDAAQIKAGVTGQNIVRIQPGDGTIDPTFDPGTGADNFVTSILPLADGSMVVGGEFDLFNQMPHERIVKLDTTGAIVSGSVFDSSLSFDATVLSLALQYSADGSGQNGQILVGGAFSNVSGTMHTKLVRLNADGSVDGSFNPVFDDRVTVVISTPDGKILVGGDFETVDGQTEKHLVRLNYDGTVDTSFSAQVTTMPPLIAAPVAVNTITPFSDGRFYIGGNFANINGVPRAYLGAVLNDGTVDSFDPGTTLTNAVEQVVVDSTINKIYVSQMHDKSVNNIIPTSVFRLFGDTASGPKVAVSAFEETQNMAFNGKYVKQTSPGGFIFTRTAPESAQALTVYFTLSGSATFSPSNKKAFYYLSPIPSAGATVAGTATYEVVFPANARSLTVYVVERSKAQAGTTATLTLLPSESESVLYTLGKQTTGTVTLVEP